MNPKKRNIDKFLETYIPSPSIDDMEADGARVLHRLKSERRNAPSGNSSSTDSLMKVSRAWRQLVVAAVLIATVGIGLYAAQRSGFLPAIFPFQREAAPQAVPPTQVAAITQGTGAGAARLQLSRLRFAAASVRPQLQPGPGVTVTFGPIKCLGADGLLWAPQDTPDRTPPRRGRCSGQGVFLRGLLLTAYASSPIARLEFPPDAKFRPEIVPASAEEQRLRGNPTPSFVAIEAVADDPERVTKGELKVMLQALLEDRFKARVHTTTRELDGYVVTIAKSGIKFKETSGETRIVAGAGYPKLDGKYTMEQVAQFLSNMLSRSAIDSVPVLDKTGLTGIYAINFALEEIQAAAPAQAAGVRGGPGGGRTDPRQFTTPAPKAVEDQLGLHVERAKVPVEFIVIDNLEPLTEN